MAPRKGRLTERRGEILAQGARLRVDLNGESREVEIKGNRLGLQALAAVCSGLAELIITIWTKISGARTRGSADYLLQRRRMARAFQLTR